MSGLTIGLRAHRDPRHESRRTPIRPVRPTGAFEMEKTNMIWTTLLRLGIAALLATTALVVGCGRTATEELVIGEFGSLTGNDATFGQSTKQGVELALSELEAQKQGKI